MTHCLLNAWMILIQLIFTWSTVNQGDHVCDPPAYRWGDIYDWVITCCLINHLWDVWVFKMSSKESWFAPRFRWCRQSEFGVMVSETKAAESRQRRKQIQKGWDKIPSTKNRKADWGKHRKESSSTRTRRGQDGADNHIIWPFGSNNYTSSIKCFGLFTNLNLFHTILKINKCFHHNQQHAFKQSYFLLRFVHHLRFLSKCLLLY